MYYQISVKTTPIVQDIVSNVLIEEGSQGVMIEDPYEANSLSESDVLWNEVDKDLYSIEEGEAIISGFFKEEDIDKIFLNIKNKITDLKNTLDIDFGKVTMNHVIIYEKDWANKWKEYFKPTKISNTIVIKPSWEEYIPKNGIKMLEIDPGMAFGTGSHETTRMCVNAIEKNIKKEDEVLDVGCGSGILSIAAILLGAGKVTAIDIDPDSIEVTKENTVLNKVSEKVTTIKGDIRAVEGNKYDLIVSNIIAPIIIENMTIAKKILKEDGIYIISGILVEQEEEIKKELEKNDFKIISIDSDGEWLCFTSSK